ncbi:MAG: alpha/beta hydrolase [Pseudomonadota bacterium]
MLRSPKRMPGRSLASEFFARVIRDMFDRGAERGVESLRRSMDKAGGQVRAKVKVEISDTQIAGVPCRITKPAGQNTDAAARNPVVVYLHGGGFVVGSPAGYQNLISQLAHHAGATVIAPDYRLSPEHPFPAAQEDCLRVTEAVLNDFADVPVCLAGDSAGGNLAINTALSLAKIGRDKAVASLLLISPWVEPTADSGSMLTNEPNDVFALPFLQQSYAAHIGAADPFNPRVNFLNADLSGLPDTHTQAGGGELFIDQIMQFHERALAAGVNARLDVFATQFHDFQTISPMLKDAKDAVLSLAATIRAAGRD